MGRREEKRTRATCTSCQGGLPAGRERLGREPMRDTVMTSAKSLSSADIS